MGFRLWPCLLILIFAGTLTAAEPATEGSQRRCILFLSDGPLHLEVDVTLDGISLAEHRRRFLDELFKRCDLDGDELLTIEERENSCLLMFGRQRYDNEFLRSLGQSRTETRADIERNLERFGDLVRYRQDDSIANGDADVLLVIDTDGDGVIDRSEMRLAVAHVAARDRNLDRCVTLSEFRKLEPAPTQIPLFSVATTSPLPNEPVEAPAVPIFFDVRNIMLPMRMMDFYDRNGDRELTAEELGLPAVRFAVLDQDASGRISEAELRQVGQLPVDLNWHIELGSADKSDRHELGENVTVETQPQREFRFKRNAATITFTTAVEDPVEDALANARRRFRDLDADGSGALDIREASLDGHFQRLWFQKTDHDGDGLVTLPELEAYVKAICDFTSLSCELTLFDLGAGFFEMLDANQDGRISVRELRKIEETLVAHADPERQEITPAALGRQYVLSVGRPAFQLFSASQPSAARPPFLKARRVQGPAWFQKLDRNADGDLTYLSDDRQYPPEFVYGIEDALRMDVDRDGLISVEEAAGFERDLSRTGDEASGSGTGLEGKAALTLDGSDG